jgi:predicted nucleotidyltransferase
LRLGYFGSYARGDWGVGSDLDLVVVVSESHRPFAERALDFDVAGLPVPAELLVYTDTEWRELEQRHDRFAERLRAETVWVYP